MGYNSNVVILHGMCPPLHQCLTVQTVGRLFFISKIKKHKYRSSMLKFDDAKYQRKPSLHLIVRGRLFCYALTIRGGDFFDHRGIYQVKRKISFNAFCHDLHGDCGIDK